jgi:hypothetical protein
MLTILTSGDKNGDSEVSEFTHLPTGLEVTRRVQIVRHYLMSIPRRRLSGGADGKTIIPAKTVLQQLSDILSTPAILAGVISPGAAAQKADPNQPAGHKEEEEESKAGGPDSRWVPPVGGAPSRHTGTGGAADGVHAQCLRDSGAGDRSRVVPRAAPRRSRVVPRSKQLGSQTRRCRAEQAARQAARRGDAEQPRRCAGRQAGAHRRGEDSPMTMTRSTDSYPTGRNALTVCPGRFGGSTSRTLGPTDPFLGLCEASLQSLTRDRDRVRALV